MGSRTSESISPFMPARTTRNERMPKDLQEEFLRLLLFHEAREIPDPYRQTLLEAYRVKWNALTQAMVPRMGKNQLPEASISQLRVAVAHLMRESIKSGKDPLTDLPNTVSLDRGITRMMEMTKRGRGGLIVLYLDLDNFKTRVNDVLGHEAGDRVIIGFGEILKQVTRTTDIAGRFHGDEFGMGLFGMKIEDTDLILTRIEEGLCKHHDVPGMSEIAVSIGASIFTGEDSLNSRDLFHRADVAMSHAKGLTGSLAKMMVWKPGMEMLVKNSSR